MSERTDSQIIHEAMGRHWCKSLGITDYRHNDTRPRYSCGWNGQGKDNHNKAYRMLNCNPDYTDPTAYLEAMAWAKEKDKGAFWLDFIQWLWQEEAIETNYEYWVEAYLSRLLIDPPICIPKLAEFLEGREG